MPISPLCNFSPFSLSTGQFLKHLIFSPPSLFATHYLASQTPQFSSSQSCGHLIPLLPSRHPIFFDTHSGHKRLTHCNLSAAQSLCSTSSPAVSSKLQLPSSLPHYSRAERRRTLLPASLPTPHHSTVLTACRASTTSFNSISSLCAYFSRHVALGHFFTEMSHTLYLILPLNVSAVRPLIYLSAYLLSRTLHILPPDLSPLSTRTSLPSPHAHTSLSLFASAPPSLQ